MSYVDPRGSFTPYHRALPDIPDEAYYQFLTTEETHEDWQHHIQDPVEYQRGLCQFLQDNQELLDPEDGLEPIVKDPLRTVYNPKRSPDHPLGLMEPGYVPPSPSPEPQEEPSGLPPRCSSHVRRPAICPDNVYGSQNPIQSE